MRSVINISLPKELVFDLDKAIKKGKYSSKSEFVRELIREKMEEEDLLKRVKISQKQIEQGKGKILRSLKDLR
ncbi:MAG: ribbon-helix-helix domain-containing protein [Candidatus Staskawiczbacteria bacterium]|nr:ribbon-helix-helix domain-containing protein [Candidatus Staskawiczbacteria bacterium]